MGVIEIGCAHLVHETLLRALYSIHENIVLYLWLLNANLLQLYLLDIQQ